MLNILGVSVEDYSKGKILKYIKDVKKPRFVVTLNPEILLRAWNDLHYRRILNSADIKVIDGIGVVLMARLLYGVKLTRFPGADLATEIVRWAVKTNKHLFILGGSISANRKAIQNLITNYQLLITNIKGLGGNFTEQNALKAIAGFKPDILFVALGVPKQEQFIYNFVATLHPTPSIMMGIGGAIDYWASPKLRAPNIVRRFGFEWLWRVMVQPWRLLRIFKATILFPIACIYERILIK